MPDELVFRKMVLGRGSPLMLPPEYRGPSPETPAKGRATFRRVTLDLQSHTFDSLRVSHVITSTTAG